MSLIPYETMNRVMFVLREIAAGQTKARACQDAYLSVADFNNAVKSTPELAALADEAMDVGYDTMADALLHIDNDPIYGTTDPAKMKVVSDNIKWYLSKHRPKKYGEKVQIEATLSVDQAIVDMLMRGRDRALGITDDTCRDAEDAEIIGVQSDPYADFY